MIRMIGARGLKSDSLYDYSPSIAQATHVQISFCEYDADGKPEHDHTIVLEAGRMLLALLVDAGYAHLPEAVLSAIRQLRAAAEEGQNEIENGDSYRPPLKDTTFTKLVPESIEEAVIDEMARSNQWQRGTNGWWLKAKPE